MKERLKRLYWRMTTMSLDGIGIIEIILILVIIIGLVLIFRTQISAIIQNAFNSINGHSGEINEDIEIK
jgi:Sec-independent protein translocase protein TatA